MVHWTQNPESCVASLVMSFTTQIERRLKDKGVTQANFAELLGVTAGRASQIISSQYLSVRTIVKCARALGMKVAIVAYDDGDTNNEVNAVKENRLRRCEYIKCYKSFSGALPEGWSEYGESRFIESFPRRPKTSSLAAWCPDHSNDSCAIETELALRVGANPNCQE